MIEKNFKELEKNLVKKGYKKITQACYGQTQYDEDYDYYKPFYNKDKLLYQIFYRVWDYTTERNNRIRSIVGEHLYGVEIAVLPQCNETRCDLQNIFVEETTYEYIERMEQVSKNFYNFLKKNKML